jgi:hypothetical protein
LVFYLKRFAKKDLLNLFLVIAFPIHVWSIFLVLRDAKWVAERTNSFDVIGYGSYALVVAFGETVFVFLIALLLSFITPRNWNGKKVVAVLGSLSFILAIWIILHQLFYLIPKSQMDYFYAVFYYHPYLEPFAYLMVVLLVGAVIASFLYPVLSIARHEKVELSISAFFERLAVLSAFYIFLDVLGLLMVIYRNISYS